MFPLLDVPQDSHLRHPQGVVLCFAERRADSVEMVVGHPQDGVFQLQVDTAVYTIMQGQSSAQSQRKAVGLRRAVRITFVVRFRVDVSREELPVHGRRHPYRETVSDNLLAEYPVNVHVKAQPHIHERYLRVEVAVTLHGLLSRHVPCHAVGASR